MGLRVRIFRSDYDSQNNAFHGYSQVTVVNVDGPFDPTPDAPAAILTTGPGGNDQVVVPVAQPTGMAGPMFGGTFASSSDSRWWMAAGGSAIRIHDRFETGDEARHLSI